jgi:dienelactone hydrolase
MRLRLAAILLAGGLGLALPAPAQLNPPVQAVQIKGQTYDTIVHRPQGNGPFPLLLIAPAKEYTMTGDLFRLLGERAAEAGYLAVRFNWRFVSEKKGPSVDLRQESDDLVRVMAHFAARSDVDPSLTVLAAKSFGARAAMLAAVDQAQALILLTPNCSVDQPFRSLYRPLLKRHRPVHMVIAAGDPYAILSQIQDALPDLGPQADLDLLPHGDHNFATGNAGSTANQTRAIEGCIAWLKALQANRNPADL